MRWKIAVAILCVSFVFTTLFLLLRSSSPTGGTVVALYSGLGTWDDSVRAAEKMFQWMNLSVKRIGPDDIKKGGLNGFRMLCVPGGDMYQYAQDLSSNGRQKIRDFVYNGGGYVGICGGAYYASKRVVWQSRRIEMASLGLFNGEAVGALSQIIPYPEYGMCNITVTTSSHPITRAEQNFTSMLYYWGPALIPDDYDNMTVLGVYEKTGQPAMIALSHGQGRVFLVGTHPEIEEDSTRDDVAFGDNLDDQGSDWALMRDAALWILNR
jgi:glutamine amidotransferase-like uncharacterized protein